MKKFNKATENNGTFSVVGGTPSNLKKVTGTRFSKVIGCNHWSDDFQAWCEIMKVAEPPFEGNKYTEAGKAIEPKLIEYCKSIVSPYIVMPEEYYNFGRKFVWDFFQDNPMFGGMWDALAFDRDGVTCEDDVLPIAVIEAKTTSRPQDWEYGVPDNYAAQGLLYAYLLGVDDVYFPVSFLTPNDYIHPEDYECTDDNTRVYHLKVSSSRVGDFATVADAVEYAENWFKKHIDNNVSPCYNSKVDSEYLEIIGTCDVSEIVCDDDLDALCNTLKELDMTIAQLKQEHGISELEEQRKMVNSAIQTIIKPILLATEGKDSLTTEYYTFKVSDTRKVDYAALIEDGLFDKYVKIGKTVRTSERK